MWTSTRRDEMKDGLKGRLKSALDQAGRDRIELGGRWLVAGRFLDGVGDEVRLAKEFLGFTR